jgi:hypothetical protein
MAAVAWAHPTAAGFIRRIEKPDVFPFGPASRTRRQAIYTRRYDTGEELAVVRLIALNEMLVSPVVIHLYFNVTALQPRLSSAIDRSNCRTGAAPRCGMQSRAISTGD